MGSVGESAIGFTSGVLAVGLSSTIQLPGIASQQSVRIEWRAGQTIFIVGFSSSPGGTGAIWGQTVAPFIFYPDYRGSLYFTAGGATALINWQKTLAELT